MSTRQKIRIPSYRLHKQSGQAIVTLPDGFGGRRDVLLGVYGTKESKAEYKRVVLEWESNDRHLPQDAPTDLTIAELIDRYYQHCKTYYRRLDGSETQEVAAMMYTLRPLNFLHGKTLISDFGPSSLKTVRELMVNGYAHPKYGEQGPICRTEINKRVKRVRRMFKWGVENDIVPAGVLAGLQAVAPLKRGRTTAEESPGVKPVARAIVEATLPLLRPIMQDMVRLQLETGMRPGELVTMRPCDIDMTGPTWLYRPPQHKTLHHGHERFIAIGPQGQAIIKQHLTLNMEAPLFSPRKLMEDRAAALRSERKTPVQPSQQDRRRKSPRKRPGFQYTVASYGRGIAEAIKRHNREKPEAEHIPHWHPHQLRHLRALELKREFGLDVARAVLGHRQPCITEHYAGVDTETAMAAMGKVG
ncbi:MAG TPA: tyrosine-type recombinase/integrase [Gemmataceae bacterium]|nr:tyrosine-type recombinase/integrase [Gemmataceae bacterium]